MKECDKRNNHMSSELRMICISSNNDRHLVTSSLHFTAHVDTSLHMSTLHFLSFKLHPTALDYPVIWLNPI